TLATASAVPRDMPMTLLERLLHMIADPNLAYIFLTVGMIGIIAEIYNPGALYPGIIGAISMLLGLTSLGMLPTGWAGVALLLLAMGLFVAEVFVEGFGILGAGAAVSFILGSLLLFVPVSPVSPAAPVVQVSPWLVGGMSAVLIAAIVLLFRVRMAMWRKPPAFGAEALAGREGVALSRLDPFGTVRLDSEVWRAEVRNGPIKRGEKVRVVKLEGVTLLVECVERDREEKEVPGQ
ncbi:MAG: nodulation protein NfeD, partial [Armatimonadota bacterium]